MQEGYSFVWEATQNPYMKTSDGRIIPLSVDGFIPYLVDESTQDIVLPAPAADAHLPEQPVEQDPLGRRDLQEEARSLPHLLTHFPKNPWCDSCRRAKLIRKACPARDTELPPEAVFGDYLTVDHMIFNGFQLDVKGKLRL